MAFAEPLPWLASQRFAVLDVETSGLDPRRDRVLQIAIVTCLGDGTVRDRWSSYVRPRWPYRVGPTAVHGITRSMVRKAPRFAEVADEVSPRLRATVLVGHNIAFDWAFLEREGRRARVELPTPARLCTLELSRAADPKRELRHRLVDVAERAGLMLDHPHDALADAEATAAALPRLLAAVGATTTAGLAPFLEP